MNKNEIKEELFKYEDLGYKDFHSKLKPSDSDIIGVRSKYIRDLAKRLAKDGWKEYIDSLGFSDTYEEKLIAGMSVFYAKADVETIVNYSEKIIPFIDGWGICDGICSTMKLKGDEKKKYWNYLVEKCIYSKKEFKTRVALVIMLKYIEEEYIDEILKIVDRVEYVSYYDQMAAAWLLQGCMAKFEEKTFEYMKNASVNDWVFNKAISKMRESFKVDNEMKETLKTMIRQS